MRGFARWFSARPGMDADAQDFLPGLLAIQDSPPSRIPRLTLRMIAVLTLLLLVWAYFAKLDIVASAEGRLVPQSSLQIVQPADAGVVTEIRVAEGQLVRRGDVLLRLDARTNAADATSLRHDYWVKAISVRFIDAELVHQPIARRGDEPAEVFGQIAGQYAARRRAFLDGLQEEGDAVEKARRDLVSAKEVLAKLRETVPVYQRSAESFRKLAREGFANELTAQEKERDLIEKQRDLNAQVSTVASIEAVIRQGEAKLSQLRSNYESQLEAERVELMNAGNKLKQELTKVDIKASLLDLRAPEDGIVKDVATRTRGSVVAPGTVLMTLVPQHDPLLAEVSLRNEDVAFVRPGQPVKLKLAPYPFQKYGLLPGKVLKVGPDANTGQGEAQSGKQAAAPPLTYKVVVGLEQQALQQAGMPPLSLAPGMQVAAEIRIGTRSVWEYLLSPVQKVIQEAARER